MHEVIHQEKKM